LVAGPALAQAPQTSPTELVRAAIQNELNDDSHVHLFAWKATKSHGHKSEVERDVQTPSGSVSRIFLINNKPLNAEQKNTEDERVQKMLDPEEMQRKLKEQQADDARTRKMLGAIPSAFDFVYVDSVTAPNGHKLTTLTFTPREGFNPPSREVAVFTGMQGKITIDETAMRLAKVDGTLFKDVNFGWGILGRLYKGGRFIIENGEITPTHWDTIRAYLHFDGKELLFKSLHIDDDEIDSDYQPVKAMSVEQALDYLAHASSEQNAELGTSSESSPDEPSGGR
jgi:hypothetical protein